MFIKTLEFGQMKFRACCNSPRKKKGQDDVNFDSEIKTDMHLFNLLERKGWFSCKTDFIFTQINQSAPKKNVLFLLLDHSC
jgi:hypothetical protein